MCREGGGGCPGASSKAGGGHPAARLPLHLHSKALFTESECHTLIKRKACWRRLIGALCDITDLSVHIRGDGVKL